MSEGYCTRCQSTSFIPRLTSHNGQSSSTTTYFHPPPSLAVQTVPSQIRRATTPFTISLAGIVTSPRTLPSSDPFLGSANSPPKTLSAATPLSLSVRPACSNIAHSASGFARPVPRNIQSQFMSLEASQMTHELIAEVHQRAGGEERPNPPHAVPPKYRCYSQIPLIDHPVFYNHGDCELQSAPPPPVRQPSRPPSDCGQRLPSRSVPPLNHQRPVCKGMDPRYIPIVLGGSRR
ncbi:hypothetical protein EI94DRAFT_901262 [Lactarius quietus]|nr:hypothetical protein EI94DRAFT_901262 [Lactarius quietus]